VQFPATPPVTTEPFGVFFESTISGTMLGPPPAPFLGACTSESHQRKIAIRPCWYSGVAISCGRKPCRK